MEDESKKVAVTVQYVGKDDFVIEVPGSEALQAIKVRSLKHFGLNAGDAGRYVLQFNNVDMDEHTKVGTLGKTVVLKLMLAEEVAKG